jgi:hypothetical protein
LIDYSEDEYKEGKFSLGRIVLNYYGNSKESIEKKEIDKYGFRKLILTLFKIRFIEKLRGVGFEPEIEIENLDNVKD